VHPRQITFFNGRYLHNTQVVNIQ